MQATPHMQGPVTIRRSPCLGQGAQEEAHSRLHLLKTSLTDECSFPSAPKGALLIWAASGTVFQVIYEK